MTACEFVASNDAPGPSGSWRTAPNINWTQVGSPRSPGMTHATDGLNPRIRWRICRMRPSEEDRLASSTVVGFSIVKARMFKWRRAYRTCLWVTAMHLTVGCEKRETPPQAVERSDGAQPVSVQVASHAPMLTAPSSAVSSANTDQARVPSSNRTASLVASTSPTSVRPALGVDASRVPMTRESSVRTTGIQSTKSDKSAAPGYFRCCDGTTSATCRCGGSKRGCCSRHGGVCGCE